MLASCASGSSCSAFPSGTGAQISRRAPRGSTEGPARAGARRQPAGQAGRMYASVPVLHGCARPAALHMPRRARSGGAAAWSSARSRSGAARQSRCRPSSSPSSRFTGRLSSWNARRQPTSGRSTASSSPRRTAGRSTRALTGRSGQTSSPGPASRTPGLTRCGTRPPPSPWTRASHWPWFRKCWPLRYPGHPWVHARLVPACPGRGGQARAGPVRRNCYEEPRSLTRSRRFRWSGGAACRNRTDDLFITSESLCRLS
jgi:hypothetical protein